MTPTPFVPVGRVMKAHGLKGEVSVAPATDLPFVLPQGLEVWLVPPPSGVRSGKVESVRPGPRGPLVKISGVDDIGLAQSVIGSELVARACDLPAAWLEPVEEEGDVIGYRVADTGQGDLGEIVEIIVTGANDVWVIDDVVLAIDDAEKSIRVRLLVGLLPEEPAAR